MVWRIFGGGMENPKVLKHGDYYLKRVKEAKLDLLTTEEWIVEVKTGRSQIGIQQIKTYSDARVEGRYRGVFAVFVQNPLNGAIGPTQNDLTLMRRFSWPHGRITTTRWQTP